MFATLILHLEDESIIRMSAKIHLVTSWIKLYLVHQNQQSKGPHGASKRPWSARNHGQDMEYALQCEAMLRHEHQ